MEEVRVTLSNAILHHRKMKAVLLSQGRMQPPGTVLSLVNYDSPDCFIGYKLERGQKKPYRLSSNPSDYDWQEKLPNRRANSVIDENARYRICALAVCRRKFTPSWNNKFRQKYCRPDHAKIAMYARRILRREEITNLRYLYKGMTEIVTIHGRPRPSDDAVLTLRNPPYHMPYYIGKKLVSLNPNDYEWTTQEESNERARKRNDGKY